jgi:hypothetical protein
VSYAALDRLRIEVERALGDDGGWRAALGGLKADAAAGNLNAARLLRQCDWIAAQDQRSVAERVSAISELSSALRAFQDRGGDSIMQINIQQFCRDWCGWRDDGD